MNTENNVANLYSELSITTPDLATLGERCKLLTDILLDCNSLPQTQPVCRCLGTYLDVMDGELEKSMTDFCVIEISDEHLTEKKEWLLNDSQMLCGYCRALNHVLLVSHFDREMLPHLTGLMHDLTYSMVDGLAIPSRKSTLNVIHC